MGGGTPRSTTKYKGTAGGGGAHGGSASKKRKSEGGGGGGGGGGGDDGDGGGGGGGEGHARAKRIKDTVVTVGKQTSGIKNKIARSELYGKLRHQKNLEKKKKRVARQKEEERAIAAGETPAPRQVPKTIENQRVRDETFVEAGDDEVAEEDAEDEFASYFSHATSPKIIITTSRKPSGEMFRFLENLFTVIPNAYYYARRAYHVQEIVKHASARGFTDLLVFNENKKFSQGAKINGLLHVHLPEGPTCLYKLSSLVLSKKIRNHGGATTHSFHSFFHSHCCRARVISRRRRFHARQHCLETLSPPTSVRSMTVYRARVCVHACIHASVLRLLRLGGGAENA